MNLDEVTPSEESKENGGEWWAGTESIVARRRVFDSTGRLIAVAQDEHRAIQIAREHNAHRALYDAAKKAANELSVMLALNPARDGGLYREALDALNGAISLVDGPQNQETK